MQWGPKSVVPGIEVYPVGVELAEGGSLVAVEVLIDTARTCSGCGVGKLEIDPAASPSRIGRMTAVGLVSCQMIS